MFNLLRAGFVRHFLSGFALGAVTLVAVQVSQPETPPMFSATGVTERAG